VIFLRFRHEPRFRRSRRRGSFRRREAVSHAILIFFFRRCRRQRRPPQTSHALRYIDAAERLRIYATPGHRRFDYYARCIAERFSRRRGQADGVFYALPRIARIAAAVFLHISIFYASHTFTKATPAYAFERARECQSFLTRAAPREPARVYAAAGRVLISLEALHALALYLRLSSIRCRRVPYGEMLPMISLSAAPP